MAKCNDGFLGMFSGRLGPAVGYVSGGRQVVRSLPTAPRNPRTARQQAGRAVFGALSGLATRMRAVVGMGLGRRAAAEALSVRHLFIRLNRPCATATAEGVALDYGALRLADGDLTAPRFGMPQREGASALTVAFSAEAGTGGDYVYLYAYSPSAGRGALSLPAAVGSGTVRLDLPAALAAEALEVYGFGWNRHGDASPSQWLGRL